MAMSDLWRLFNAYRTDLVFGDLRNRIENGVGQPVGRGCSIMKWDENSPCNGFLRNPGSCVDSSSFQTKRHWKTLTSRSILIEVAAIRLNWQDHTSIG